MDPSPKRLLDPSSRDLTLASLAREAQGELGTAEQLARIRARLPGAPPPTPPAGGAVVGVTGALVAAVVLLTIALGAPRHPASERQPPHDAATPAATTTAPAAPPPEQPREFVEPRPPEEPAVLPQPAMFETGELAPTRPAARRTASRGEPRAELDLLDEAQRALRSDPREALAALDEHRLDHPHGTYAQEREVLALQALIALGRVREARVRAERFAARWPSSAYRSRVAALSAGEPVP